MEGNDLAGDLKAFIAENEAELIEFRRDLHAHPEVGYEEHRTTRRVALRLAAAGLRPVVLPKGTGLLVDIGGSDRDQGAAQRPVVALRADLDALPMADEKDVPYRSTVPNACHACGHDVHTTVLLGTGLFLAAQAAQGLLPGRVRLIFQPAEEVAGGALDVLAAGGISSVGRIFALHCDPRIDVGQVGVRAGPITAACDRISVRVTGPGGHTARPHMTADLVYALGKIVTELPAALSRRVDPRSSLSLVWGRVSAGTTANAIPSDGIAEGTVRCLDDDAWQAAPGLLKELIESVASAYGVSADMTYARNIPPTVNDAMSSSMIAAAVEQTLGPDAVVSTPQSLGGEDFAWYLESVPGAYARLGVRTPGALEELDLHRPTFNVDERAIGVGVHVMAATALNALWDDSTRITEALEVLPTDRRSLPAQRVPGQRVPGQRPGRAAGATASTTAGRRGGFRGVAPRVSTARVTGTGPDAGEWRNVNQSRTRIAIIGGGPGGYEAALVAAQLGAEVTLVERDGLGGACVLTDCVPSKTLIESASTVTVLNGAADLGIRAGGRGDVGPVADPVRLYGRIKSLARAQSADVAARVAAEGVEVIEDTGRMSGPHTVHAGGHRITADAVLIAVGAHPRVLPDAVPDGERILNWRQLYDLPDIPEELIVVGSGVTGAEFASAYQALGSQVTLVSSRERVLPHEDIDAAVVIEDVFRRRGMTVLGRSRAASVKRAGDRVAVTLTDGRTVRGSHCLLTVGMEPSVSGVGLEDAGVKLDERGFVAVDRVSRTSAPGVYAAGDCTGKLMLASVAAMQGRIAMWHALGEAVHPIRMSHVAATIFTDPEIATVGVSHNAVESGEVAAAVVKLPLAGNPRAKMAGVRDGFVKLYARPDTSVVLGGVVVGPRASELILPVSIAVEQHLTVDQMAQTFTVYPSLSGSLAEAARKLMRFAELPARGAEVASWAVHEEDTSEWSAGAGGLPDLGQGRRGPGGAGAAAEERA